MWTLRSWFKFTFLFGLFLSVALYGRVFLDHHGPSSFSTFRFSMYEQDIIEITRQKLFKWHIPQHEMIGYRVEVLFANREVINYTWDYNK